MMKYKEKITQLRVRKLYREMDSLQDKLEAIRANCKHKHIEIVDYQVRAGMILEGSKVCQVCGELIEHELLTMNNASIN